jgi:eukaryotic-like serine/threonine-protein kinase
VTEFADNGSVEDRIGKINEMELSEKLRICIEISEGLAYLHKRDYMHRDIKPANILLDKDFHAKVCDFGTSKVQDLFMSQTAIGTPIFMDPAVMSGKYTNKCDIYSLGMVFFFLFTGNSMFGMCKEKRQLDKAR